MANLRRGERAEGILLIFSDLNALIVEEVSLHAKNGHHHSLLNTSPIFKVLAFPKLDHMARLEIMVSIPLHCLKIIIRGLQCNVDQIKILFTLSQVVLGKASKKKTSV